MASDAIDKLLQSRKAADTPAPEGVDDKFFSILVGETTQEHFLEFKFENGLRICFSYTDLQWFNFDPEGSTLDLEFGGFLVTIKGRGLGDRLFNGIKQKRVAWVAEAGSEMEDHKGITTFVSEITISPPSSESGEQTEAVAS